MPITQTNTKVVTSSQSCILLHGLGINGQILATPGHSDDSISLSLESGEAFTGDLPLFELCEVYADQTLIDSWNQLLARGARTVYPAHGLPYRLE